jgi:hypothetical protein
MVDCEYFAIGTVALIRAKRLRPSAFDGFVQGHWRTIVVVLPLDAEREW